MRNQPSGWFFYACENLGLLCGPQGYANFELEVIIVGAALAGDGPQSGPKILKKKKFSDDWQVSKPLCKEIYTQLPEFSLQFRFFLFV